MSNKNKCAHCRRASSLLRTVITKKGVPMLVGAYCRELLSAQNMLRGGE